MKKLLTVLIGAALVLGACGGGNEAAPATPAPTETPATDATAGTFDATAAEATYKQSCAACHGANLQGASAPTLVGTGLSKDEILTILREGQGTMPAGLVRDGAEVEENLAAWIAAQ